MKNLKTLLSASGFTTCCMLSGVVAFANDLASVSAAATAPGMYRDALKMKNQTKTCDVSYFYSDLNNKGKDRWYWHDVRPGSETWDWTWVDCKASHSIEFMVNRNNGEYVWFVIVYQGVFYSPYQFTEEIFWVKTNDSFNPDWSHKIWYHSGIQHVGWYSQSNIHTQIVFMENGQVVWNNYTITI